MSKSTQEGASIAQAEIRLADAKAQLLAVESEAAQATQAAKKILEMVSSGDTTITVDDFVRAAPEAERRAAIVPHYRKAVTAAEQALRKVKTDELIRSIESGVAGLLTYEQLKEKVQPYVQEIVDVIGRLELDLATSANARRAVIAELGGTTAGGPPYLLPNGQSDSPLQLQKSDRTLTVNGVDYPDIFIKGVVSTAFDKAQVEVARRRDQSLEGH
ncbi:hypothetical protein ACFVGV_07090 [Pseudarthrobacter scleromae]|uniref:hypothetical protein n=1 Tax=Pseudarthrobacter scleromae TaxID=158897 RepID=UPI003626C4EC